MRAIGNDLHMDYSAIGQTTHLAARMEQLAPPGSIRLTAETLRLAEGLVQVTPLGPVPVKGLAAPVEVCELVGAGPARTRLQALAARGLTPFVGRQAELAALHRALAQAGAGQGQVVAVVGDAGVGKTRLFHEFTQASRTQGWPCWRAARPPTARPPPICRSRTCSRPTFTSTTVTTAGASARSSPGGCSRWIRALAPTLPAFLALLEVPGEDPVLAGPRSAATPPAHPGGPHPPVPAGEPGPAPPPGLREPALDRRGDAGVPRRPGGAPARRPPAPAGQLPPRVPARLGRARPTTPSSGSTRCRPRAPRACCRASWGATPVWNR